MLERKIEVSAIIKEASKTFEPGHQLKINIIKREHPEYARYASWVFNCFDYPSKKDSNFQRDAHLIEGTNFIASRGPRLDNEKAGDLDKFWEDTVFHSAEAPKISMPTYKIIALGNGVSVDNTAGQGCDFINYFIPTKDRQIQGEKYTYSITKSTFEVENPHLNKIYLAHRPDSSFKSSYLTIHPNNKKEDKRQLEVTFVPLVDNGTIDLIDDSKNAKKEALWNILKESEKERFLIHCAAGIGRTGHLILTLEILKHYKDIFEAKDVTLAAAKIHEIVSRMRKERYCLIQVKEQLIAAISNAHKLYEYGLEKGYIKKELPSVEQVGLFSQSNKPSSKKDSVEEDLELVKTLAKSASASQ